MNRYLFLLFLVYACSLTAQKKSTQIDSLLSMLQAQSQFNGNVLIVQNGKEILKKSYGLANRKTQEKLNANTIFELASVSKQFTATGIILLNRQGKLSYNDKLTKYFPELKFGEEVRLKNLLNHSSGIPEYFGLMMQYGDPSTIATNKDVIEVLSKQIDSLNFQPNARFEYCNTNYLLLASIIEKVSKTSFHEFMKTHIFKPLKMKNTFIFNRRYQAQTVPNYAYGYVMGDQQVIVQPDSLSIYDYVRALDGVVGDGMVNSTINDLRKWDQSLRAFALIQAEEFEYLQKLDTLDNGKVNTYSFGWNFREQNSIMSHSGSWPGYVSYIHRDIKEENLILILQNFNEVVLPIKSIIEILEDQAISSVYKKEIQLAESTLKKYIGTYIDPTDLNSVTTLTLGKNALIYNSTNNPWDMPFYPNSETTFFSKTPRMNIGFEFIEEGVKMKLIFLQNDQQIGESIKK